VRKANEDKAVACLMVTDSLFRAADVPTRKSYIALVEEVKDNGGEVLIFSSSHVSGEQLAQLSGVAALLRFPLPDMNSFDEEVDSEDEA
jgi:protein pelota